MNTMFLKMYLKLQNLMNREEGQDLVEYGLLMVCVALAAVAILTTLGTNIAAFYDAVTQARFDNPTVPLAVRSNLASILGRLAARRNRVVTWEEMLRENELVALDLNGLKA